MNRQRSLLLIISGIVIVIVVGSLAYYLGTMKNAPSVPVSTPTPSPTLKTITDATGTYSIQLPTGWHVDTTSGQTDAPTDSELNVTPDSLATTIVSAGLYSNVTQSAKEWANAAYSDSYTEQTTDKVNGYETYAIKDTQPQYTNLIYFVKDNTHLVVINFALKGSSHDNTAFTQDYLDIVQSIRFTK